MKYECIYLHDYATVRALEAGLAEFFLFYNEERLHAALDYLTPAAMYAAARGVQRTHGSGPNQREIARNNWENQTVLTVGVSLQRPRETWEGSRGPLVPSI